VVFAFDVQADDTVKNRRPFLQLQDIPAGKESAVTGHRSGDLSCFTSCKQAEPQSCFFRPQSPANIESVRSPIPSRMNHFAVVAAVGISVASCAGTIKEGMVKFEGQSLSAVVAKIGEPIDERTIAARKVYIWGSLGTVNKGEKGKCQIRATMDGDLIASFEYEGDEELCQRYAARLRP
jgi:hypothetical protein